jgi:hypothetical protein
MDRKLYVWSESRSRNLIRGGEEGEEADKVEKWKIL